MIRMTMGYRDKVRSDLPEPTRGKRVDENRSRALEEETGMPEPGDLNDTGLDSLV